MPHHDATEFPEPTHREAVEGWQRCQAKNARLQERVETSEVNWATATEAERVTHREWDRTLDERDGYEALAKVRGEALGKTKCLHNPNYPCIMSLKDCPAEWCLRCRAIAMTPEEAKEARP